MSKVTSEEKSNTKRTTNREVIQAKPSTESIVPTPPAFDVSAAHILGLQRTLGNQAVQRMLTTKRPAATSSVLNLIQCERVSIKKLPDNFVECKKQVSPEFEAGYKYGDFAGIVFFVNNPKTRKKERHTMHLSVPGRLGEGGAYFEDFHVTLVPESGEKGTNLHFHFDAGTGKFMDRSYAGYFSNSLDILDKDTRESVIATGEAFAKRVK
jgi:hypothetical protein